jgi:hypothetical protein
MISVVRLVMNLISYLYHASRDKNGALVGQLFEAYILSTPPYIFVTKELR